MNEILTTLWLFIPAAIANMIPVAASKLPVLKRWKTPIDMGKSWRGKRILGDNKTWRGILTGIIVGGLIGYLQHLIRPNDMDVIMQVLFAVSISFGALYGDAVESFFKRQANVPAGQSWFPFDQIDFVIGGMIAAIPYRVFGVEDIGILLGGYFLLHLVTVYVFFKLGIRERPI